MSMWTSLNLTAALSRKRKSRSPHYPRSPPRADLNNLWCSMCSSSYLVMKCTFLFLFLFFLLRPPSLNLPRSACTTVISYISWNNFLRVAAGVASVECGNADAYRAWKCDRFSCIIKTSCGFCCINVYGETPLPVERLESLPLVTLGSCFIWIEMGTFLGTNQNVCVAPSFNHAYLPFDQFLI